MKLDEFKKYLFDILPTDNMTIYCVCAEDTARIDDFLEFIEENKIDCKHLWEDNEAGDKAYQDYFMLSELALAYDGIDLLDSATDKYKVNFEHLRKKVYDFLKRKNRI